MNTKLLIFKDNQLTQVITNNIPEGLPLFSARLKEQLNGEVSLSFSVPSNHPDSVNVERGNIVLWRDLDGLYRAFTITEEEEVHDENGLVKSFLTEELAVTELNDKVVTDVRPQNVTAREALSRILKDTKWQVGTVADLGTNSTNVYYESAMSGLQKVVETWGGEVRFRVTINEKNQITGRYVDLLTQLGRDEGKRFEYGRNLTSVTRYVDLKPLKTALYGRGKGEETDSGGYGRRTTFADVVWSKANGDPIDKPAGQEWVGDPEALQRWGSLNADGTRSHKEGVYINEEQEDPRKLLEETWAHLQTLTQVQVNYSMNVMDLERDSSGEFKHEAIRLGDTRWIIDRNFTWDINVKARVIEIDRDLLCPDNTSVTLGNFIEDLNNLVREIQKRVDNKIGVGDPIGWLEGVIDAARSEFHSKNGYVYITDKDGILVTNRPKDNIDNPPTEAIQLKAGALAIANSLNPDGSFAWRTFITGEQIIADMINTGRIRTDSVEIGDSNGNTLINQDGITVKNGAIKVYSTADASDPGILIEGNRIVTNFVKNADFDITPNPSIDWTLAGGSTAPNAVYDPVNKIIKINTTSTMSFIGISQFLDIYHPRATLQALFKCNLFGGSTPKNVRFYFYNFDKNGVQLADRSKTEQLSTFQEWHLLNFNVEFPTGTVRSRMFVQVEMKYAMTNGFEIHWVKGCYDEYVTQQQLTQIPQDQYNALPELQQCFAQITHSGLTAGQILSGEIFFEKTFRSGPGRINVQATAYGSNAGLFHVGVTGTSISGCNLVIRPFTSISSGTIYVNVLAYRVSYYGNTGF